MNRREFCKGVAALIPLAGVIGMVSLEERAELLGDGSPAWELPLHDGTLADPARNMYMAFGLPKQSTAWRERCVVAGEDTCWPNMGR